MNWTKEQQKIIDVRNNNILVSAAAGSGKTAVLVERIIQMIFDKDNPINVDELLVVTFTNAAASQMKEKIARAIEKKIDLEPENEYFVKQLNLVSQANILTIDSFCYKIVKEYFHVLGIDPKIKIAEEADVAILRQKVLDEVIEEAYTDNADFSEFSSAYSADKNDMAIEDYILRLYDLSESYSYPAIWLDKAKKTIHISDEEMFNNLPYMEPFFLEIHKQAECIKRNMQRQLEIIRGCDGPKHYEKAVLSDIALIDSIISAKSYRQFSCIELEFEKLGRAKKESKFDKDAAEEVKKARGNYKTKIKKLLDPFSVPIEKVLSQYLSQEKMLSAYVDVTKKFGERFLQVKLEEGVIGFSDIEHFALKVLCDGIDEYDNPIPSKIAQEISDQFKEILIDEYQDSNFLQEDILKCVSGIYTGRNNMFMVGDVKQSIYAFRMARPDLFIDKYNRFIDINTDDSEIIDKDGIKIVLKNNFRSRANVLECINYLFYQMMRKELGGIDYGRNEALVPGKDYFLSDNDDVELLIGESKDVEYLEVVDSDENSTTDSSKNDMNSADFESDNADGEHLDDEYIDVGAVELEASMVAERIKKLMGADGEERLSVMDDEKGIIRPVEYRDIVILFRSPKSYQAIFSEILKGQEIPVRVQNDNGYFDTVEIRALLSLLRVIDNPNDDVEYIALLRGFFGGLGSEELAVLTLMMRSENRTVGKVYYNTFVEKIIADKTLYNKLCEQSGAADVLSDSDKFYDKLKCISDTINDYRNKKKLMSVSELISDIFYNTGYYYYAEAMPEGISRTRNLLLLLDETERFEGNGYRSLFDFLQFIKRLSEKGVSLGGDPAADDNENVVKIMSAHKSKGLEFPVVFVSGTGKKFNLMDTRTPIILHADYYVNAKYIDNEKRYGCDTFGRKAMASIITAENIAEELRILYVALTRAKEKLIITGVTPDISKLILKYSYVTESSDIKLDYDVIRNASNYLELITAAMIRNQAFHKTMGEIRQRYNSKGELVSGSYVLKNAIENQNAKFSVYFYDFKSLIISRIETGEEQGFVRMRHLKELENMPAQYIDEIEKNLSWKYDDHNLTTEKSKLSVTEIKRVYETNLEVAEDMNSEEAVLEFSDVYAHAAKKIIPKFISDDRPMDASMRGTWMHKVMEVLDFTKADSVVSVKDELEKLYYDGKLPKEIKGFVSEEKIFAMVDSELGKRMKCAAEKGLLKKEKKFVVGVNVSDKQDVPEIIVQGIIDAYFKEDGYLILVDYKTDRIKPGQEDVLKERYCTQMKYYKDTLEKLTKLTVKETYLYSFALDKPIKMW